MLLSVKQYKFSNSWSFLSTINAMKIRAWSCSHQCVYTHTLLCLIVCADICVNTHVHVCVYTHIYTYTHVYVCLVCGLLYDSLFLTVYLFSLYLCCVNCVFSVSHTEFWKWINELMNWHKLTQWPKVPVTHQLWQELGFLLSDGPG